MKAKIKGLFRPADIAAAAAILIAAAALFAFGRPHGGNITATIQSDGEIIYTIDLSQEKESRVIELENGMKILVEPGKISVIESGCAGQHCVRTGELVNSGDCAVCLPNKTLIKLSGKQENSLDAAAG